MRCHVQPRDAPDSLWTRIRPEPWWRVAGQGVHGRARPAWGTAEACAEASQGVQHVCTLAGYRGSAWSPAAPRECPARRRAGEGSNSGLELRVRVRAGVGVGVRVRLGLAGKGEAHQLEVVVVRLLLRREAAPSRKRPHTAVGFGGRTCTCTCTCTYRWGPKGYRRDGALVHGVVHALVDNLLVESLELLRRLPPRKELDLGVLGIVLRREVGRRRVASHLLGGLA